MSVDVEANQELPDETPHETIALESDAAAQDDMSVARATGVVALGNIVSRVLGLGRMMLLSDLFGAGIAVDAFNVAVIVPKTLFDLLIGGHVNSALVPVLSEYAMQKDRNVLWQLVNMLLGMVIVILALLVLVLELLAPQVVSLIAGNAVPEIQELATNLLRITTPALMFLSVFAVLSGLLYALRRFTLPAFAGALFNASIVIVTLLFAPTLGITAMAVGWLVGAFVQMSAQLLGLRDARLRPTLRRVWAEPGVRRIVLLYIPVMFSLIIDTMVIRLVSYRLAAQVGPASISYMEFATTLIQFPHGLVATAISIAILPTLSRQAVLISTDGAGVYKDTLGRGLRLAIVLIIPATIGLFVIAPALVGLLFEHGSFTTIDTAYTALALRLYLFGLPFAAVDLLLVFAFYSQQDTLTPALIGVISLVAYMAVALSLMPRFGLFSLMIADSIKHMLHASIAAWLLSRRIGGLKGQQITVTTGKTLAAALVMGVAVYFAQVILLGVAPANILGEILVVGMAALAGVLVYVVMAGVLRIGELYWMGRLIRDRLGC
ncbi:murein biosynthesis integral membrane protein MurJ [Chloroflexota bacterium]